MKRLLLILISFLVYTNCLAQEMPIQLYSDHNKDWVKDDRSLSVEPTAIHNDNTIRIYSSIPVENVSVILRDQFGNIVYSSTSVMVSRCHIFELHVLSEGTYTLKLEIGVNSFYGYLSK